MKLNRGCVLFLFLVACMGAGKVQAQWTASIYSALEYDDNVARSNSGEQSDISSSIGGTFEVSNANSRHSISARYNVEKQSYRDDSFDERTNLTGGLSGRLVIVSDRFFWNVSHDQSMTLTDSRSLDTPDNREERSTFSTGPELYLRLSALDSIFLNLNYLKTDLERSEESDSYSISSSLRWSRILSEYTAFNFELARVDSRFDENSLSNYKRDSATVGFTGARPIFDYNVYFGVNRIDRRVGGHTTGKTYGFNLSKSLDPMRLVFGGSRELTDSVTSTSDSDLPDGFLAEGSTVLGTNVGNVSIVENTNLFGTVDGIRLTQRLTSTVGVRYLESQGEGASTINQKQRQGSVTLNYTIADEIASYVSYQHSLDEFLNEPTREDTTTSVQFGLEYETVRGFSASFTLAREESSSDSDEFDFVFHTAVVRVAYTFGSE
ncbi:MAG: hypothetical protein MI976_10445 [Pseudomonadales bacterium]|nr:hypothetical protein [Pseudomonadales bacterium]